MTTLKDRMTRISRRTRLGLGAAILLGAGAAGGAGGVSLTRPTAEMAPIVTTTIAKLPSTDGIVTIKGRIAEVFGNRFIVQDQTGRTMIDAGRLANSPLTIGQTVSVQGRYDDGQLRPSYLVGPDGRVTEVGPGRHHGRGPGRPHGGPDDGPPPPLSAEGLDGRGMAPPRPGCDVADPRLGQRVPLTPPPPAAPAPAPAGK